MGCRQAVADPGQVHNGGVVAELDDAHIGVYLAERYLAGEFLYSAAFRWMRFDGRRWASVTEGTIAEVFRQAVIDLYGTEARSGASVDRLKAISRLFSAGRMRAVLWVARNYLTREGKRSTPTLTCSTRTTGSSTCAPARSGRTTRNCCSPGSRRPTTGQARRTRTGPRR